MIPADKTVIVPAQVLQDLIWNAELACAGMGKGEDAVHNQCQALQAYIDRVCPPKQEPVVTIDGNVTFANFRR